MLFIKKKSLSKKVIETVLLIFLFSMLILFCDYSYNSQILFRQKKQYSNDSRELKDIYKAIAKVKERSKGHWIQKLVIVILSLALKDLKQQKIKGCCYGIESQNNGERTAL